MNYFTKFEFIYKVKIWRATLRELLLIYSLYLTKNLGQLFEIIQE